MVGPVRLLVTALSDVDPQCFLLPICIGLGGCFIAAISELERFRENMRNRRRITPLSPQPRSLTRRHPPDHRT
jgi:hypothetical protein